MAVTATLNVSGVAALRYILVDTTTFYFTNAVDGQRLVLTLQQDGTGSRAIVSGNCPGIMSPAATANTDSTQVLAYDSATNTWNGVPQQSAPGGLVLNTTTTNTSIAWARGSWLCSGTLTMTITNPVAGPPGTGNDGETMIFIQQAASALKLTMGTTQTMNGTSTSVITAAAVGSIAIQAWGGKVYITAAEGATTLS
jgi:hypothetical protein